MGFIEGSMFYRDIGFLLEYVAGGFIFIAIVAIFLTPFLLKKLPQLSIGSDNFVFWMNVVRGFLAISLLGAAALHPDSPVNASTPGVVRFLTVLLALYLYYVLFFAVGHLIRQRIGRAHCRQQTKVMVDTYRSRGLTLSIRIVLSAILIIILVHSLEANDLLRTSGLIAALLVVIGLSQSAWAPDYISGLVILYSEMYKEGDTVKLLDGDQSFFGEIYRIKAFHTEILSFTDNHRVIIQNSRMREYTIHNLSKFASAKGLREKLSFKIGYDTPEKQIQAMFKSAFVAINRESSIPIERVHQPEVRVQETGDHAVEWSVYYFTKETKRLLWTRQAVTEIILLTSKKFNVSLATPLTHYTEVGTSLMGEHYPRDFAPGGTKSLTYGRNFGVPIFSE